ncbi:Mor transcription activator family protein [Delftia sp. PS-11]|uniref:Mor transcription activator family protein n=1 Tax=Delftia sp. PS-11 TaxID=2767222 RepID=UPI0024581CCF|nr:Mor transcription activator family protein [Delftia sp. PS-11]KAJ8744595.1 hypothetical protein H9T68_11635 [Delftia sp. PS-11]
MNTPTQVTRAQAEDAALQLEHEMVEIVRAELNMHEREAFEIAKAIVRGLRKRYGGLRIGGRGAAIYVPAPSKEERNEAICREYDGTNMEQVMAKHGIRRTQVYRILNNRPGAARIGVSAAKSPVSRHEMGQ